MFLVASRVFLVVGKSSDINMEFLTFFREKVEDFTRVWALEGADFDVGGIVEAARGADTTLDQAFFPGDGAFFRAEGF